MARLSAWSTEVVDEVVTQLIDGPDDFDRIDLLGQLRVQEIPARVLGSAGSVSGPDSDDYRSYLKNYPELGVLRDGQVSDGELAEASLSVRYVAGAILADVALLGDGDELRLDLGHTQAPQNNESVIAGQPTSLLRGRSANGHWGRWFEDEDQFLGICEFNWHKIDWILG